MEAAGYVLGVDIGTTSVKVCVFNPQNNEIVAQIGKETQSNVPSDQGIDGNKQDVPKIISALNTCVAKLQKNLLQKVSTTHHSFTTHGLRADHQNRDMRPDARSHVLEPGQGLGEGRKGQQPGAVRRRPRGGVGALHLAGQQVRPGLPGHAARPAITSSGLHRLRSGHHLLDGQK
jgi:hypothetical protein